MEDECRLARAVGPEDRHALARHDRRSIPGSARSVGVTGVRGHVSTSGGVIAPPRGEATAMATRGQQDRGHPVPTRGQRRRITGNRTVEATGQHGQMDALAALERSDEQRPAVTATLALPQPRGSHPREIRATAAGCSSPMMTSR